MPHPTTRADRLLDVAIEAPVVLFEIAADGSILTSVGSGRDALRQASTGGENLYDLYADVPAVLVAFERARSGEAFSETSRVPGKDGERVFETTYVPVFDGDAVVSVRGVALDITARVRAQEAAVRSAQDASALTHQLLALADRLQTEREDERRRVARDVHDELGQSLTALQFESGWLRRRLDDDGPINRDAVRARLDDVDTIIDRATRSVQGIASGLRPPALDLIGLTGAVEAEAVQFAKRTGARCRVTSGIGDGVKDSMSDAVTLSLFRVVQEALTNVARHARASAVEVRLLVSDGHVVVEVEDDGLGFDASHVREGALGLVGVRERAAALQGVFEVRSEPGRGTLVRASVSPHASPARSSRPSLG